MNPWKQKNWMMKLCSISCDWKLLTQPISGAVLEELNVIKFISIIYGLIKSDCKHHTSPYKVDFEWEVYIWVLDSVKEKKNSEDNGDKDTENGNAEPKIASSRGD